MVKFDLKLMLYMESEDFRVLSAVETGMRNHELVPAKMVCAIAELRSGTAKIVRNLCYNRLVSYERGKRYDGYRLTNMGYDYLALRVLRNRGLLDEVGNQIGVGKEASVYIAQSRELHRRYALKVHRLGRTSFKTVFSKRDYHQNKVCNWLYMSRLAALREYAFMKALHRDGFSVPEPIDQNRHCVLMSWIDGTLLNNVLGDDDTLDVQRLFGQLMDMILELANKYGVVHGDFNEFNILLCNGTDQPVLIDFPQMVPTNHKLAREYFERDVHCIRNFFEKRFSFTSEETLDFDDVVIDEDRAAGYIHEGVEDAEFLHKSAAGDDEDADREKEPVIQEEEEEEEEADVEAAEASAGERDSSGEEQFEDCAEQPSSPTPAPLGPSPAVALVRSGDLYVDPHEEMAEKLQELGISRVQPDEQPARERLDSHRSTGAVSDDSDRLSMMSHSASRFGGSSVASSFTSDQIRGKLRKEKERKAKRELIQNTFRKVKGDSSAVGRKRQDNKHTVREDASIYEMF